MEKLVWILVVFILKYDQMEAILTNVKENHNLNKFDNVHDFPGGCD